MTSFIWTLGCSIVSVVSLNLPFHLRKLWVIYLLVRRGQKHSSSQAHQSVQIYSSCIGKNLASSHTGGKRLTTHVELCVYVSLKPAMEIQWCHLSPLTCVWLRTPEVWIRPFHPPPHWCLRPVVLLFGEELTVLWVDGGAEPKVYFQTLVNTCFYYWKISRWRRNGLWLNSMGKFQLKREIQIFF